MPCDLELLFLAFSSCSVPCDVVKGHGVAFVSSTISLDLIKEVGVVCSKAGVLLGSMF